MKEKEIERDSESPAQLCQVDDDEIVSNGNDSLSPDVRTGRKALPDR